MRVPVLLSLLLTLSTAPVAAHRPYAVKVKELPGPQGETVVVEKLFGDGLFSADPVSLQVRGGQGAVIAYTSVSPHVGVFCPALSRCWAFPHDSMLGFPRPLRLDYERLEYRRGVTYGFEDPWRRKENVGFQKASFGWTFVGPFFVLLDHFVYLLILALVSGLSVVLSAARARLAPARRALRYFLFALSAADFFFLVILGYGVLACIVPWLYGFVAVLLGRWAGRKVAERGVVVRREDIASPVAASLIGALNAELSALYPEPGATHFQLDADEVAPGRGGFFVACVDSKPLGCGAVRRIDKDTAELKRMYVAKEARGRKLGKALLARLIDEARALGVKRVVLETGVRQEAAQALYRKAGFKDIPAWGEYVSSPISICMAKDL